METPLYLLVYSSYLVIAAAAARCPTLSTGAAVCTTEERNALAHRKICRDLSVQQRLPLILYQRTTLLLSRRAISSSYSSLSVVIGGSASS